MISFMLKHITVWSRLKKMYYDVQYGAHAASSKQEGKINVRTILRRRVYWLDESMNGWMDEGQDN